MVDVSTWFRDVVKDCPLVDLAMAMVKLSLGHVFFSFVLSLARAPKLSILCQQGQKKSVKIGIVSGLRQYHNWTIFRALFGLSFC